MRTWVALLRGINLAGYRKVSMPALRDALTGAGFAEVRTYVNSGNVVLRSPHTDPDEVSTAVGKVIAETFDLDVPVVVRTRAQLTEILDWNPFPEAAAARPHLVAVVHLVSKPAPAKVRDLLAADVAPDRIAARGAEVVVAYAERSGAPKTNKALKALGVDGTARNWRTLTALVDLAAEPSGG